MEPTTPSSPQREQRFREIYDAAYLDVLRFARRRVHPTHAEDVVGDVMLVAWRRLDDIPADVSGARAWLFGVTRKVLSNAQRGQGRRDAVAVRLADARTGPVDPGGGPDLVALRMDVTAAWSLLSASEQEAIALATLDGLSGPQAASVLGISPIAFRLRLSRARRRLRGHLDPTTADDALSARTASERSLR